MLFWLSGGISIILRHITQKVFLKSIYNNGYLDSKRSEKQKMTAKDYVSFELYEDNGDIDGLLKVYVNQKGLFEKDCFSLFFDGDKMREAGISIVDEFENGGRETKYGDLVFLPIDILTLEEAEKIGEYRHVKGNVSLEYLTKESLEALTAYIQSTQTWLSAVGILNVYFEATQFGQ